MNLVNRIILLFQQPIVIVSIAIGCIYAVNDFTQRFSFDNNDKNLSSQYENLTEYSPKQISSPVAEELLQRYSSFFTTSDEEIEQRENTGLTMQEQLEQSGELSEVYIGEYKIELKAVITAKEHLKKVLLLLTNLKTNEKNIEEYLDNSFVHDFKVQIKSNTQVFLSRSHSQGEQEIMLNMYQVQNSK